MLDEHERARLAAFRRPADAARYLAAHALVRITLAERLGIAPAAIVLDRTCRCGKPHGKPRLALPHADAAHFSLTHSGERVGVALSGAGPVGLDVEQLRELTDLEALAAHALSPTELRRPPPLDAGSFLQLWTRKEALLKATGEGLSVPMTSITLSPPDGPAEVVEWGFGRAWLVDLDAGPGHPAALAGFGISLPEIRTHDGDALLGAVTDPAR